MTCTVYSVGNGDKDRIRQIEKAIESLGKELFNLGLDLEPRKTNVLKFEEKEEENLIEIRI